MVSPTTILQAPVWLPSAATHFQDTAAGDPDTTAPHDTVFSQYFETVDFSHNPPISDAEWLR